MPSVTETDRGTRWLLPGIVLLYLAVTFAQSAIKLLWGDELITYYVAQQTGWGGIWRALAAGADPNPPLIHVLVQASTAVFGSSASAVRLPAILCVLLAIVAMWSVLRRWVAPQFAAAGVLAFMCTRGFDYSYDARSYAPLMAFAMAAFALWVQLPDGRDRSRGFWLAGLAVALGLGISSNYYGVLAFFPIAAGELAQIRESRKFNPDVWVAMLAGASPLVAYLPLIRHNIAEFAPHAWNRPHASMVALSYFELVEGVFWPVLFLAIFAVWKCRKQWTLGYAETMALLVLLLYPVIGFAVAVAGAGMISPRCVVPVCCGFGLALGVLASVVFGQSRRAGWGVIGLFLIWTMAREGFCALPLYEQRRAFLDLRDKIAVQPEETLLVADSAFVLPLYFYSEAPTRSKIVFPIDFPAIHQYESDDSGEQNLWAGRKGVFPFPIVPYSLPPAGKSFAVIGRQDGWLAHDLEKNGIHLYVNLWQSFWWSSDWRKVGGVFTPMAHEQTRVLHVTGRE